MKAQPKSPESMISGQDAQVEPQEPEWPFDDDIFEGGRAYKKGEEKK